MTNGDIGHWRDAGGPLARRRKAEVGAVAQALGITSQVLDIHDGELLPTLDNRRTIARLIREWNADIVMSHRPNDYHPDHRYTGTIVQDVAYMVAVPFFAPDTAPLKKNPVFVFYPDNFQKPTPFQPDIAVAIDSVMDKKLDALMLIESQFYEGGRARIGRPDSQRPDESCRSKAPRPDGTEWSQSIARREIPQRSDGLVRPGARRKGAVRRSVRNLRVWPQAEQGGAAKTLPILRRIAGSRHSALWVVPTARNRFASVVELASGQGVRPGIFHGRERRGSAAAFTVLANLASRRHRCGIYPLSAKVSDPAPELRNHGTY